MCDISTPTQTTRGLATIFLAIKGQLGRIKSAAVIERSYEVRSGAGKKNEAGKNAFHEKRIPLIRTAPRNEAGGYRIDGGRNQGGT
jgi:hypothetical protein